MSTASECRKSEKLRSLSLVGEAMRAAIGSPKSDGPTDITTILSALDKLRVEETKDRQATLERKYGRLGQAYAHGLILREDENLREQFFAKESWEGFRGHTPRPGVHGRDEAMHFAVMRVLGGTKEGRKDASMYGRACTYLATINIPADGFMKALKTEPGKDGLHGPKALAALAPKKRQTAAPKATSQPLETRSARDLHGLRITPTDGVPIASKRDLFVIAHDDQVVLSLRPDKFEPVTVAMLSAEAEPLPSQQPKAQQIEGMQ